ncbi:MAG TPA: type IV pilin [Methanocorpusculum sp.]|nr:type IV pilin [Methanocorpusculum sp.]
MYRISPQKNNDGVSPVVAVVLLIVLTIILCLILAAFCMAFFSSSSGLSPVNPPEILAIESVDHYNDKKLTFASKVKLRNIGTKPLWNSDYSAEVYIDDTKQLVVIKTLKVDEFIPTQHFGVKTISGSGPIGYEWEPGNSGVFDLEDGMIQPGFLLRIDIIKKEDGKVISRSIKKIE